MKNDAIDKMVRAKVVLAPMSGVTDIPFRMMARKFGCAFAFTEMIDVNGIIHNNRKTFKLMDRFPGDSPLGVQLVGQDEEKILYAAKICEEKGFDVLDINAGCPARKVVKGGKGAALLKDPVKLAGIIRKLVKELAIPVTVKIRSGWDKDSINYMEVAKAVVSEGAKSICIHSRRKDEMYRGKPDHNVVSILKKEVKVPVFASGNIFSLQDVKDVFAKTGCDGVFLARGALGRPWFFREINDFFSKSSQREEPPLEEIKNVIIDHCSLNMEFYNKKMALKRMYKHLTWYLKRLKGLDGIMRQYKNVEDFDSFCEFIKTVEGGNKQ
ncbi:MAG: tRNA dihydrouridine synthase DusB [Candidatus Omnitrophota bacterium]